MSEDQDKGFKVSDRRLFRDDVTEEASEKPTPEAAAPIEAQGGSAAPPPETTGENRTSSLEEEIPPIDFTSFVLSLASSILIHLGEVPDPTTNKRVTEPSMAKQSIDVLSILQEKTKGNLTDEESRILDSLLADLRLRYLKAVRFIA